MKNHSLSDTSLCDNKMRSKPEEWRVAGNAQKKLLSNAIETKNRHFICVLFSVFFSSSMVRRWPTSHQSGTVEIRLNVCIAHQEEIIMIDIVSIQHRSTRSDPFHMY